MSITYGGLNINMCPDISYNTIRANSNIHKVLPIQFLKNGLKRFVYKYDHTDCTIQIRVYVNNYQIFDPNSAIFYPKLLLAFHARKIYKYIKRK